MQYDKSAILFIDHCPVWPGGGVRMRKKLNDESPLSEVAQQSLGDSDSDDDDESGGLNTMWGALMELEAKEHLRRECEAKEKQLERDSESDQQPLCEAKEKQLQRESESKQQPLAAATSKRRREKSSAVPVKMPPTKQARPLSRSEPEKLKRKKSTDDLASRCSSDANKDSFEECLGKYADRQNRQAKLAKYKDDKFEEFRRGYFAAVKVASAEMPPPKCAPFKAFLQSRGRGQIAEVVE